MTRRRLASRLRPVLVLVLVLVLDLVLVPRAAHAQRVDVKSAVDATTVEEGDTVTLTMQAMVENGSAPSDPQPGAHAGLDVVGTSVSPINMTSIVNGVRSSQQGIVVNWRLRANRAGSYTLGPPSVSIDGRRQAAPLQHVKVVGRGQAPPKRPGSAFDPFGTSPFDPWKGLFDFGDERPAPEPQLPTDPKLALDYPRAPVAFLHATVDKTHAVVGEQVTLTVYLYQDPFQHAGQPSDVHEATATDFSKRALVEDQRAVPAGNAMVGGKPWVVSIVRKDALFPLKSGRLAIDPMSLTLPQARAGLRESERLFVDVGEPPIAGRPAGYTVGDVGNMSLLANVAPRSLDQDGAIGVTLELRGTGNLPAQLPLPVAPGIEWLESQTRDVLKAVSNDKFGGTRTFSYVVRVHKAGAVDLGEVRLPFWDPDAKRYDVARASLGIVDVRPVAGRDAGVEEAEPVLPGLPPPRAKLEGAHEETFLAERPIYWGMLFGAPFACALAIGVGTGVSRIRARRAARSPSPERIAREKRAEADDACKKDDGAAAMGAIARAIEATVLARTGLNLRGTTIDTTERELEDRGVAHEASHAITDVLRACHDARFSPDGVEPAAARDAWKRVKNELEGLHAKEADA